MRSLRGGDPRRLRVRCDSGCGRGGGGSACLRRGDPEVRTSPRERAFHVYVDRSMMLDAITLRNLEVHESIRGGTKGATLFSILDRTRTPMGGRSCSVVMIQRRAPGRARPLSSDADRRRALQRGARVSASASRQASQSQGRDAGARAPPPLRRTARRRRGDFSSVASGGSFTRSARRWSRSAPSARRNC